MCGTRGVGTPPRSWGESKHSYSLFDNPGPTPAASLGRRLRKGKERRSNLGGRSGRRSRDRRSNLTARVRAVLQTGTVRSSPYTQDLLTAGHPPGPVSYTSVVTSPCRGSPTTVGYRSTRDTSRQGPGLAQKSYGSTTYRADRPSTPGTGLDLSPSSVGPRVPFSPPRPPSVRRPTE